MSTFFEKLTGAPVAKPLGGRDPGPSGLGTASPQIQTADPIFSQTAVSEDEIKNIKKRWKAPRVPKTESSTPEEPMPKHLKIETEGPQTITTEEPLEEEGELTVDIYDHGNTIVIQSTVAGVKPEDLDISITSDTVTIRGKRVQSEQIEDKNYYYKELFWGAFARTIILPEEIEDAEAEAAMKNGLLTIVLPKKKRGVVQKVKVKVT